MVRKVLISSSCLCVMVIQHWTVSEDVMTYKMKWCSMQLYNFEGVRTVGMEHKVGSAY